MSEESRPRPRVDAIIIHFGDEELTRRAVYSAAAGTVSPETIVVVDNDRQPYQSAGSVGESQVVVVRPGTNTGFAGGVSAGVAALDDGPSTLLWLLNNDAVADRAALSELIATAVRADAPAIVSSRVLDEATGTSWVEQPTYLPWRLESRHRMFRSQTAEDDVVIARSANWRGVPYLPGCSLLMPLSVFRLLGGFDRAYFVYGEDVDLSIRAMKQGIPLLLSQRSIVRHRTGSGTNALQRERLIAESSLRLTTGYFPWLIPVSLAVALTTGMKRSIEHRNIAWLGARVRGYASFVTRSSR